LVKNQVVSYAWDQATYLNTLKMTTSDLSRVDRYDEPINAGQLLNSVKVVAPPSQNTSGGPVYVSVGQHIDLEVTAEALSAHSEVRQTTAPVTATTPTDDAVAPVAAPTDSVAPAAAPTVPTDPVVNVGDIAAPAPSSD
jgi:hypothetical protein